MPNVYTVTNSQYLKEDLYGLTLLTSGSRSVGIVRSRTQATELVS
jgi:hypothetical protein